MKSNDGDTRSGSATHRLPALLGTLAAAAVLVLVPVVADVVDTPSHEPFPSSDYQHLPPAPSGVMLAGTNYSHYQFRNCDWNGGDVLAYYGLDHVRELVHHELLAMRRAGVQTLRTIIWHMTDPGANRWGPVSSAGGVMNDATRANFVAYLTEVRRFGFRRLTISFGPQWTNDPIEGNYDSAKFSENWHFIEYVRSLLKRYGPRDTRIDLLNEGAPGDYSSAAQVRRMTDYDRRMYALYVRRYGDRDVTISVIAPQNPGDASNRLQNLITLIRSSGLPEPRWFDIHAMLSYADMLYALQDTNAVLMRNKLSEPVVIGEAPYDDPAAAAAIRRFDAGTGRVQEVLEWYHRPGQTCNTSPPYMIDAYLRIQRGVHG